MNMFASSRFYLLEFNRILKYPAKSRSQRNTSRGASNNRSKLYIRQGEGKGEGRPDIHISNSTRSHSIGIRMASSSELSSLSSGALESRTATPPSSNTGTVNLFDLSASCLAAAMAASEPIRRIALGSISSPPRTPAVSAADEGDLVAFGVPSSLVVVEEGAQHENEEEADKPASARSLGDFSFSSFNNLASGGRIPPSRQSSLTSIASRSKADGTLVTDADGAAQRLIVHAIRCVNPRVTIVGEESAEEENRLSSEDQEECTPPSALETLADQAILASTPNSVPPAPSGGLLPVHQWESCWRFAQEEVQRRIPESVADIEVEVDPSRVSIFGKLVTTLETATVELHSLLQQGPGQDYDVVLLVAYVGGQYCVL
jgi:hypothetical protein